MSRSNDSPLTVSSAGKRAFIQVASGRAMALHAFLRAHSILCSPPDPSSAGVDVIELRGGSDVKAVQTLLDRWG